MRRAIVLGAVLVPALARAQNFPPDSAWVPLRCHGGVMEDGVADVASCTRDCDVVGQGSDAAGYGYADSQYLFLRLRIDGNPQTSGIWNDSAWGFEVDTDGNLSTYEILITVCGLNDQVEVSRNTNTTLADSPADFADSPPLATFPISTHARAVAAGSQFGGNADFYVDVAVPWTTLQPLGFGPSSSVRLWAGTSVSCDALNFDLACNGGRAVLSGAASDPGPLGGSGGTGGSGGGGAGAGGSGGPRGSGCSCAVGGGSGKGGLLLLGALLLILRGRRCSSK